MQKTKQSLNEIFRELKTSFSDAPEAVEECIVWSDRTVSRDVGRYKDAIEFLAPFAENNPKILDVGGFPGTLSLLMQKKLSAHVDIISYHTSEEFQSFLKQFNISIFQGDITQDFPLPDKAPYNIVTLNEVIEHICDPVSVLNRLKKFMCSDGLLFLSTPNQAHLRARIEFLARGSSRWSYPVGVDISASGLKGHVREYTAKELQQLLTMSGFSVVKSGYSSWETRKTPQDKTLPNCIKRWIPAPMKRGLFIIARKDD